MSFQPSSDIAVGRNGFKFHGTGAVTGVRYDAIVVHEDCVFTSFKTTDGLNAEVEILTDAGMSGRTIKAGTFLSAGKTKKITAFNLSSGSIIGY